MWPLFSRSRYADGWELSLASPLFELVRRKSMDSLSLWPLFEQARWGDGEKTSRRWSVLGPVVRSNATADRSDFRVLWRVVQNTRAPEKSVFAVNPFFHRETNARGDSSWQVLFGMFGRTTAQSGNRTRLFWFLEF